MIPALTVTSVALDNKRELLEYADKHNPLVWLRERKQAIGVGEAVRLSASGKNRYQQLAAAWAQLCKQATIHDEVALPGSGLIAFGSVTFGPESKTESVLIVPRIILHQHDGIFFKTTVEVTEQKNLQSAPTPECAQKINPESWRGVNLAIEPTAVEKNAYLAQVNSVLAAINSGKAEKIVLARQVRGSINADEDLRVPLQRLSVEYADCAIFAVDGFVGASPETLARAVDGKINTRVLAGTAARDIKPMTDKENLDTMLASAHIAAEHSYAAAGVIADLQPLTRNLKANKTPHAVALPNVWHLATDIEADTQPGYNALDIVAAMQPTAAVCGTPRNEAAKIIATTEDFDRARYAGSVGWISATGDGEWALALRCAQVYPAKAGVRYVTAYAGGGIVAGSDPLTELQETVAKFVPIKNAFLRS